MEKPLNNYDKEYMKMAMLKHEETFREQVCELHRLYEIQKTLMKNLSNGKQQQDFGRLNFRNSTSSNPINNPPFLNKEFNGFIDNIEDESELELTLGPTRRKKVMVDNSDSGASFSSSSSSTISCQMKSSNSGCDHQRMNAPRQNLTARKWNMEVPGSNPVFLDGRRKGSDVNPPWLFQAMGVNTGRKNHLQSV